MKPSAETAASDTPVLIKFLKVKKTLYSLPVLLLAAITALTVMAAKPRNNWETSALKKKADYLFLEGVNAHLRGEADSYFALVSHAHNVNPEDIDINNEYGMFLVQLQSDDSASVDRGIAMMRDYFDKNSGDLYSGLRYALINQSTGDMDEALRAFGILHRRNPENSGISRRYAEILAQAGGLDSLSRALEVYDTLEVIEGNSLDLATARMRLMFMRNDTAAIINEGRRQWSLAPMSVENNVFFADVFATFEKNDSALYYFNRANEIDSLNPMAAYSRATFYNFVGDSIAFDREIFRTLKLEGLDMPTKMQVVRNYISELYADTIQRPRIMALFKELVNIHPHEPELRKVYAAYLAATGEFAEAAEQQDLGMSLEPDDEQGWNLLASFFSIAKNNENALDAINRGIHYFPESGQMYYSRGLYLSNADSIIAATADLRRALEMTDSSDLEQRSLIITSIGDLYYRREMVDSAINSYHEAIQLNPYNTMALNNCAYFLACEDRDLDDARRMIEKVMSEDANEPTWIDTYAWVLFKQKEYERAREEIDRVLELSEKPSSDIFEHAGDIYFFDGKPDKAVEFWKKALELDPDNELLKRKVTHSTYFFK